MGQIESKPTINLKNRRNLPSCCLQSGHLWHDLRYIRCLSFVGNIISYAVYSGWGILVSHWHTFKVRWEFSSHVEALCWPIVLQVVVVPLWPNPRENLEWIVVVEFRTSKHRYLASYFYEHLLIIGYHWYHTPFSGVSPANMKAPNLSRYRRAYGASFMKQSCLHAQRHAPSLL
jgi:hypothetical protein